jgi:glycosyltransferase involved in cell wall biosynthesis
MGDIRRGRGKNLKTAVYTIALNERQFVDTWYESAKDADYLLIADTGSTDGTVERARELGINVVEIRVSPWRFDDARNAALAALPIDIDMCVSLDMDEVITPGWKEKLTEAWERGVNRPRYKHIWSWNEDGTPGLEFSYDHIHGRKGFRWRHPVHECIYSYSIEEKQEWIGGLETHHHPDPSKSRSQYLPLLELSVREDPHNDRNAFYYGRELYFYGRYMEAAQELKRHLELPTATWAPERAASMRFIGKSLPAESELWFRKAIDQAPGRREPWVDLTKMYYDRQDWVNSLECARQALAIKEKPLEYLCEAESWGAAPHDYAAIAAYNLRLYEEAFEHSKAALSLEPDDKRYQSNFAYCARAYAQEQERK